MKPLILLTTVLCLLSCNKEINFQNEEIDRSKKQTLRSISYGNNERHTLDIALPKNRNEETPVVIFIHGGAWVLGDKRVFSQEIQDFADAGIACATINYRYASSLSGIHHPQLPEDVMLAVNFIASMSSEWGVSDELFGLVGHSAGGHLATITPYIINNEKIKSCASWAGPVDFIDSDQLSISGSKDLFEIYVGAPLISYQDTSLYKLSSPYHMVNSNSIPTLLIYATEDEGVPYSNGIKMNNRLQTLGINHKLVTLTGAGHIWLGNNLKTARQETLDWFRSTLAPQE